MPVHNVVTPGVEKDGTVVEFTATTNKLALHVEFIGGFGWTEDAGSTTRAIALSDATIPGMPSGAGIGECFLVGNELVWVKDSSGGIVRVNPSIHSDATRIMRVHADSALSGAIVRMSKRARDRRDRAGQSRRDTLDNIYRSAKDRFEVRDREAENSLSPFKKPSMYSWLQPSSYGVDQGSGAGGGISPGGGQPGGGGGASLEQVEALIASHTATTEPPHDDTVSPGALEADSDEQKAAFRTRNRC